MDTAYGGCIRKSRQIGQRWRQDHDWLCLSFLAISDCKLLGRAKSDFHAFSNDAQARPPGLNPRTLSTRINTMSHFSEILRSMPSILSRKLFSPVSMRSPKVLCVNGLFAFDNYCRISALSRLPIRKVFSLKSAIFQSLIRDLLCRHGRCNTDHQLVRQREWK